jgi:ribonuclease Z
MPEFTAKLVVLGSSNAISSLGHENTHFALLGENSRILIDCPGNPIVRLCQAGIDHLNINDVILTHFHPDHVSGLPLFLMDSWLLGRKAPLTLHGIEHALTRARGMMDFYDWQEWPGFYPVDFQTIDLTENAFVLENDEFRISATPVKHLIPGIGLKIVNRRSGYTLAHSSDTEPCEAVVRLAAGADVLIHEASGATFGHSSASQAGEIAAEAGVKQLYLIHYPTFNRDTSTLVAQAKASFPGEVFLAEDFMEIPLG